MKTERAGELFVFSKAFVWSFFPIITGVLVATYSPIFAVAFSTVIAAGFFAVVLTVQKHWHELRIRSAWKDLFLVAMLNGVLFYALFFTGLRFTSPGNASIIALTEVFFSMFFLGVLAKTESLNAQTMWGGVLMVVGTIPIIFQGTFVPNMGDLLIILAVSTAPLGNYYTKKARSQVGPTTILFVRSVIAGICLFVLSFVLDGVFPETIALPLLVLFFVNGLLLLGASKILWIEALHRLTISKSISLMSLTPVFTLFFAYIILGDVPTIFQIGGLIPIAIGVRLLTHPKKSST